MPEGSDKPAQPGSGIRSTRTTSVFRAVNFELFATPVSKMKLLLDLYHIIIHLQRRSVMILGAVCMTFCAGYLLLLNSSTDPVIDQKTSAGGSSRRTRWEN